MYQRLSLTLAALAFASAAAADAGYWKQVDASFATMLATPDRDAAYVQQVNDSFARMLHHSPYFGDTQVTVARGVKDPVELALHAPAPTGQATANYFAQVDTSFQRAFETKAERTFARIQRFDVDPMEQTFRALTRLQSHPGEARAVTIALK